MSVSVLKRLFTVDEYYQMARNRILNENDRVELIEGEIIQMSPIGSRHASSVKRLIYFFSLLFGNKAMISAQDPIHINDYSEPQPDIVLLKPRSDFYAEKHPAPEDIFLVVEVADTSGDYDRNVKIPLYARAGILESWIVNLDQKRIEMYRIPSPQGYEKVEIVSPGQTLSPQAFPELSLSVDEILG